MTYTQIKILKEWYKILDADHDGVECRVCMDAVDLGIIDDTPLEEEE